MKKSRSLFIRWKLPYIALIGLIFALIAVFGRAKSEVKVPPVTPPKGEYYKNIAGIGIVEPKSELISIGVGLAGVVSDVHIKVGDHVKKNDVLFTLDQRDINAQIVILEWSLDAARVQAEDANARFAIVNGMKDKRAVAKDDFNRRKFGKALAAVRVEEIKAQLNQARTTKERLVIKAPIDGQVLEVNIRPGEFAGAQALNQSLMRMGDVSTLHVRVEINEENASHILAESAAQGLRRGDTANPIALSFVRFEPYVKPKQNLAVANQRVDTRVLQVIYALSDKTGSVFVGQQMDIFIDDKIVRIQ
jgi:HlyD family secretion protein